MFSAMTFSFRDPFHRPPPPPPTLQVSSHLPPTGELVEEVLSSPQFQSALSTFHSGLASGQLGPLMSQFGLGEGVTQSAASGSKNSVGKPSKSERFM